MGSPLAFLSAIFIASCFLVSWKHGVELAGITYLVGLVLLCLVGWIWWRAKG